MILHITTSQEWETADSLPYTTPSLHSEGFIHCSTPAQLLMPANEKFHGRTDLILLCIDPDLVTAAIIYEDCYETGHQFPHIYGPLNRNAVTQIIHFPPNPDGTFSFPHQLRNDVIT